ncbi:uncharacterized protein BDR25DRAFT_322077 [Lindgomyces ingoldianus]|uniref:Uncharacterized protein n=1 Tax=Lindgomyces ingoldianus TaxID=673940 RepID=A0ACB6RBZ2_9PLEO|nr:uncharacterized protein BDR25DRAFT_322077 [Lindgomyces ingoldianus]KAF2476701.1 hypothetical protein BDR25DRAFT_322077 [Lindgomyces ingoldianus]
MASKSTKVVKIDDVWQVEGRPREGLKILSTLQPSNLPGKIMIVAEVNFPPNGATPAHRHGGAAVVAVALEGTTVNQMNCEEPITCPPGSFWYEAPGCHHVWSENMSKDDGARFLAILIVDEEVVQDGMEGILVLDAEVEAREKGE